MRLPHTSWASQTSCITSLRQWLHLHAAICWVAKICRWRMLLYSVRACRTDEQRCVIPRFSEGQHCAPAHKPPSDRPMTVLKEDGLLRARSRPPNTAVWRALFQMSVTAMGFQRRSGTKVADRLTEPAHPNSGWVLCSVCDGLTKQASLPL